MCIRDSTTTIIIDAVIVVTRDLYSRKGKQRETITVKITIIINYYSFFFLLLLVILQLFRWNKMAAYVQDVLRLIKKNMQSI